MFLLLTMNTQSLTEKVYLDTLTIETANEFLDGRLKRFKLEADEEKLELIALDINEILTEAINLFPTQASAVEVNTYIDLDTKLLDKPMLNLGRERLKRYLEAAYGTDISERKVTHTFTMLLPYTTKTGSRERKRIRERDHRNVVLNHTDPYLTIDLSGSDTNPNWDIVLLPEEVHSIRLVRGSDRDFTKTVKETGSRIEFKSTETPWSHYLSFCRFEKPNVSKSDIPTLLNMGLLGEYVNKIRLSKSIPFTINPTRTHVSGFVSYQAYPGEEMLYLFEKIRVPFRLRDLAGARKAIWAGYCVYKNQVKRDTFGMTIYRAEDIIKALSK